jgi:MerR family transcriptional regulator, light-induced transcriptional regulator
MYYRFRVTETGEEQGGARLAIGALSRAAGVPVETIRTWERRYGFPVPERRPSGHRLYRTSDVPRLQRIATALARGIRAGQAVPASDRELDDLLAACGGGVLGTGTLPASDSTDAMLAAIRRYDRAAMAAELSSAWGRLGPVAFLEERVAPAVRAVGEAWAAGTLDVRHEHFFSERLSDLLRMLRGPLDERATGPLVSLATLPGEAHGLGLQMVALALSSAGCRVLVVGTDVPVEELSRLAAETRSRAVGISMSLSGGGAVARRDLRRLCTSLGGRVEVLVGGEGAPRAGAGFSLPGSLAAAEAWGRTLSLGARRRGAGVTARK